ncbi:toll-like receptor 6 isoform X2 [Asterias rubens]|nr:toll-like receptor 6 isoform X2 [Asterias rubens]XP_033645710.1 toll-like receptor 6 isoform X2 [Asterias rubens]
MPTYKSTAIFYLALLVVFMTSFPYRASALPLPRAHPFKCPMRCRCFVVSQSQSSASRLLQENMAMYSWRDGDMAVGCWGRRDIPTEILPNADFLFLLGESPPNGDDDFDVTDPSGESDTSHDDVDMRIKNIPDRAFKNASGLRQLDIRGNKITGLQPGSFVGLQFLEILSLKDNRLRALDSDAWWELQSIRSLILSGNNLRSLPEQGFRNSSGLLELDLGGNLLEDLSPRSLSWLPQLRFLNLSHNRLVQVPGGLFSDLVELQELYLDGNRLEDLPVGLFDQNSLLEVVSLRNNRLHRIPELLFYHQVNLRELDLYGNHLIELGNSAFATVPALRYLDISHNIIEELNNGTFQNCSNLLKLDASFNRIREVRIGTFGKIPSLQELILSNNNISSITPAALAGLRNLAELDLTNNALRHLRAYTFYGLEELISLQLDNNSVLEVEPEAFSVGLFSSSSKLTWLYLRMNLLSNLTSNMFQGVPFLKMLNLADNKIDTIGPSAFRGLRSLTALSLKGNHLWSLEERAFSGMVRLKNLDLSGNSLHRIDEGAFQGLRFLQDLNMEENELDETTADWLVGLTSLSQLNLNRNRFARLPPFVLTNLRRLRQLFVAGNILDTFRIPELDRPVGLSRLDIADNNLQTIEGSLHGILEADSSVTMFGNPWNCDCGLTSDLMEMTSLGVQFEKENITICETIAGKQLQNIKTRLLLTEAASEHEARCGSQLRVAPLIDRTAARRLGDSTDSQTAARVVRRCKIPAIISKGNGTWPWHGIVWDSNTDTALCNAALIGKDWAITTLRCLQPIEGELSKMPGFFDDIVRRGKDSLIMAPHGLTVRLGKSRQLQDREPGEKSYHIMNIHVPANDRGSGLDRPILLQFVTMATVTKTITPACIANSPLKSKRALVLGWGTKREQTRELLQSSRMKLDPCDFTNDVTDTAIFCGVRDRGKPIQFSMEGNMGGNLVLKRGRGDWILLGIGSNMTPKGQSVFVDVGKYASWVYKKTEVR